MNKSVSSRRILNLPSWLATRGTYRVAGRASIITWSTTTTGLKTTLLGMKMTTTTTRRRIWRQSRLQLGRTPTRVSFVLSVHLTNPAIHSHIHQFIHASCNSFTNKTVPSNSFIHSFTFIHPPTHSSPHPFHLSPHLVPLKRGLIQEGVDC